MGLLYVYAADWPVEGVSSGVLPTWVSRQADEASVAVFKWLPNFGFWLALHFGARVRWMLRGESWTCDLHGCFSRSTCHGWLLSLPAASKYCLIKDSGAAREALCFACITRGVYHRAVEVMFYVAAEEIRTRSCTGVRASFNFVAFHVTGMKCSTFFSWWHVISTWCAFKISNSADTRRRRRRHCCYWTCTNSPNRLPLLLKTCRSLTRLVEKTSSEYHLRLIMYIVIILPLCNCKK